MRWPALCYPACSAQPSPAVFPRVCQSLVRGCPPFPQRTPQSSHPHLTLGSLGAAKGLQTGLGDRNPQVPNGMERDSRRVGKARPGGGHTAGSPATSPAKKGLFAAGSGADRGRQGAAVREHWRATAECPRSRAGSGEKAGASRSPAPKMCLVRSVSRNPQRRGRRKEGGKLTDSFKHTSGQNSAFLWTPRGSRYLLQY